MLRLGELLRKQGHFLLENDHYALLYIAILALIPFATWLSVAIVALITLRKGWVSGLKGLMIGSASFLSPLSYVIAMGWNFKCHNNFPALFFNGFGIKRDNELAIYNGFYCFHGFNCPCFNSLASSGLD